MMWWYAGMGPLGWSMMLVSGVVTLLLWGGVAALIVWAIMGLAGRGGPDQQSLEVLRRRFAAGEINETEFEQARRALRR